MSKMSIARRSLVLAAAVMMAAALAGGAKPPTTVCPNPEGGTCLGPLTPGTHTTKTFSPKITYTVPRGWFNEEDLPGNFALYQASDTDPTHGVRLNVFRQARASRACDEAIDPRVGHSAADLVRMLESKRSLLVTDKHRVTVDGLHGWSVDLTVKPGRGDCTDPELPGFRFTPTVIGNGISQFWWSLSDSSTETYIFLDWHHDNLLIVESDYAGGHAQNYERGDRAVLGSLRFAG
jgi:hypothetical protein